MTTVTGRTAPRRTLNVRRLFGGLLMALTLMAVSAVAPASAATEPFPDSIDLPDGFFPEGITIDDQTATGYVGSLVGAGIQRVDLRTGESTTFAEPIGSPAMAVGMTVDDYGRLWVAAGGPILSPDTIPGFRVYDAANGDLIVDQPVAGVGFVNDVIATDDAVWFTDSLTPNLIRIPLGDDGAIGAPELVALAGEWVQTSFPSANGIAVTPDGKHLILAQATGPEPSTSALYVLPADLDAAALDATRISLDQELLSGDGLVLIGRTLYAVGGPGVTKVRLGPGLTNGNVVEVLNVPDAVSPTTADARGSRLYVVDAKFPFLGDSTTPFQVTAIAR